MRLRIYALEARSRKRGRLVGTISYERMLLKVAAAHPVVKLLVQRSLKRMQGAKASIKSRRTRTVRLHTPRFVEVLGIECWKKGLIVEIER
ncbi:MAG: hypothetical protein WC490_02100 [Candidatus Margulisiibacteriota bacterium]